MSAPDELTTDQQRELHGWFGDPWPSGICYNDDGTAVSWTTHKQTPLGEPCSWCDVPFVDGDQGVAMPHYSRDTMTIGHAHKECMLRQVVGSLQHLQGDCPGDGSCHHPESTLSAREDALAVWEYMRRGR